MENIVYIVRLLFLLIEKFETVAYILLSSTKQDLPASEVPNLETQFTDGIMADVKKVYASLFGNAKEVSKLRARSWKEPHLLLYQNMEGQPLHTGVEMHYDGCSLTWNCLLSSNDEFTGGGTYIRALKKTVLLKQGQVRLTCCFYYHITFISCLINNITGYRCWFIQGIFITWVVILLLAFEA